MQWNLGVLCGVLPLAMVFGASAVARAESAVVLPPHGDARLEEARTHAGRVLATELELQGLRVIGPRKGKDGDACRALDCAPELIRQAGADIAVAVAVWAGDDGLPANVYVTLVDARGARYPGKAGVEGDDVPRATRTALLDARALQLLGPGPWVRVRGEPEGAQVLIDGTLVGSVPYRAAIRPGRHVLEVKLDGYRPHLQNLDIPPNDTKQLEVEAALASRGDGAASGAAVDTAGYADGLDSEPTHPVVGPLILGGVGVAVMAADVVMLLQTGCTERDSTGRCIERRETNDAAAITWGALGGAAIVGAVLWYSLGEDDDENAPSAELGVGPGSVVVRGTF